MPPRPCITVSWQSGTDNPPAPPDELAHVAVEDQLPATTAYRVTGVVKVMFELPNALPIEVPDHVPPAPAAVISIKSTFEQETVAAVIVRAVPTVFDATKTLLVVESPLQANVPVHVMFP
jgi:hypothetical protein